MLVKESEMLQDAFCKHIMQQNATAAEARPGPRWGGNSAPPNP